jgi:hypothetical protein
MRLLCLRLDISSSLSERGPTLLHAAFGLASFRRFRLKHAVLPLQGWGNP